MNITDKINKAAWNLVESIRDTTTRSVVTLVTSKQIEIKPEDMQKLIAVISTTIEAGYQNGTRVFERTVNELLKTVSDSKSNTKEKSTKKS